MSPCGPVVCRACEVESSGGRRSVLVARPHGSRSLGDTAETPAGTTTLELMCTWAGLRHRRRTRLAPPETGEVTHRRDVYPWATSNCRSRAIVTYRVPMRQIDVCWRNSAAVVSRQVYLDAPCSPAPDVSESQQSVGGRRSSSKRMRKKRPSAKYKTGLLHLFQLQRVMRFRRRCEHLIGRCRDTGHDDCSVSRARGWHERAPKQCFSRPRPMR